MLKQRGRLGGAWLRDEQKPAEGRALSSLGTLADNPIGGWYGLKKGPAGTLRHVVPAHGASGLAEVEHNPRGNRYARGLIGREARRVRC